MINITYICDKCKTEHSVERPYNNQLQPCPTGWGKATLSLTHSEKRAYIFCGDCNEQLGFSDTGSVYKADKQSTADKLLEVLFEMADEAGFTRD